MSLASPQKRILGGIAWSAVEKFSRQGLQLLFTVIIARQLTPSDYGLVAMLQIYLVIAQIFVDSGFVEALIQKQNRTEEDFSTVFWFNVCVSLILYAILVLCSPAIASFYNQPLLRDITIWLALIFVINSFRTVQQAKLNIAMDFRHQAWISIVALTVSGICGVWMAGHGYGVWTLVWQQILQNLLNVVLLWTTTRWKPSLKFSKSSFQELFAFGSKLLLSRTLHGLYTNGSLLLIGKFYSPAATGLYSQSSTMSQFLPSAVNDVVARVAYTVECELQDEDEILQHRFYQMLRMTCFCVFPIMMGLVALAEPLVRLFLTEKWLEAVPLIRILCFAWIWWPASNMSWQLLNAKHRSDYCLKSEIIKKSIAVVILVATIPIGLKAICGGIVAYFIIDLMIITQFTKRILPKVTFANEMKELLPILFRAAIMGMTVHLLRFFIHADFLLVLSGGIMGIVVYSILSYLMGAKEFRHIVALARNRG